MQYKSLIFILFLLLSGCDTNNKITTKNKRSNKEILSYIDSNKNKVPFAINHIKELIQNGDFKEASKCINISLSNNNKNALLHILNGFVYNELSKRGDSAYNELSGIAYRTAYNIEPNNWYVVYLYGKYLLKNKNYYDAQLVLSEALILNPNNQDILHCLAYVSYYIKDLTIAAASIEKAVKIKHDPIILRAASIIFAAAGKHEKAQQYFCMYKKIAEQDAPEDVIFVQNRISDWKKFHSKIASEQVSSYIYNPKKINVNDDIQQNQADNTIQETVEEANTEQTQEPAVSADNANVDPSIIGIKHEKEIPIMVECCIMTVDESDSTSKGTNILDALADNISISFSGTNLLKTLTFPINPSHLLPDEIGQRFGENKYTKAFNFAVTAQDLKYNLNIMNASNKVLELVARPIIATILGKTTSFVSGTSYISANENSNGIGNSLQNTETGIHIEIKPTAITSKNKIIMHIKMSQSTPIIAPDSGRSFNSQVFTLSKSSVDTVVKVAFDETIMIFGLYQRSNESAKSSVPVLGELPLVQYFFANEQTNKNTSVVLYLLTPRRGGAINKASNYTKTIKSVSNESLRNRLSENGLLALDEYTALRYIFETVKRSSIYDFRTGDLLLPFGNESLDNIERISQIFSFFYF